MTIPKHLMEAKLCNKDTCAEVEQLNSLVNSCQEEIRTLKEENQRLNNVLNELKEWFKEFHKYQSRLKWNENDYIEFIDHLENELKESDK